MAQALPCQEILSCLEGRFASNASWVMVLPHRSYRRRHASLATSPLLTGSLKCQGGDHHECE